jgi:phenylalanyl-tRNA synthetase beta chain
MRVPLSWLRDYVDVDMDAERLAERLTLLGMEVQRIERRGDDWRSVVVGELLEVTDHPGSGHLHLARVRTGEDEPVLSIVCGADNIAAGQRVPVALPGAVLPGDRRIEVSRIAGTESQGMLCSGDELGITTDAEGILILPPDAPLGRPLADVFGDTVLDVDVKPNRGDALSLVGIAREVAAVTGGRVRWPEIGLDETGAPMSDLLRVEVTDRDLCPRFVGRHVDGIAIGPSPLLVQARLTAAGQRPVSNVVDASNYVMLELGKPTHTFDAAAIAGGTIVVRLARTGERLETLDHVVRELTPDTLLIADEHGPIGIAGVMGGAASEVSDGTTAVVIESAVFDPVSIRRTARRYALRSEASLRFEKGQEPRLARIGADRVAQLVVAWAGGRVARGRVDTAPTEPAPARLPFRPARIRRLLGADVPDAEMRDLLSRVEIATEPASPGDAVPIGEGTAPLALDGRTSGEALVAIVPTHRRDLGIEADIAEEVARVRGYETIPGTRPDTPMPDYRPDPRRIVDALRDLLAGRGLHEVVTHALVGPLDHERLGLTADDHDTIRVTNPLSVEHSQLRRSLLPGLASVLVTNERQRRPDVAIYEVGATHRLVDARPFEAQRLGILLAGDLAGGAWNQPAHQADLWDAIGLIDWLVARLGIPQPQRQRVAALRGVEHPGRTVELCLPDLPEVQRSLGRAAELDPRYTGAVEARAEHVIFAEISLDALGAAAPADTRYRRFPRVPAVERDLAVVVGEDLPAGDVERLIRRATGDLLADLRLFDVYRGAPLASGQVSLAYRLTLQAPERTLADSEIEDAVARVVGALERDLGAHIRS